MAVISANRKWQEVNRPKPGFWPFTKSADDICKIAVRQRLMQEIEDDCCEDEWQLDAATWAEYLEEVILDGALVAPWLSEDDDLFLRQDVAWVMSALVKSSAAMMARAITTYKAQIECVRRTLINTVG